MTSEEYDEQYIRNKELVHNNCTDEEYKSTTGCLGTFIIMIVCMLFIGLLSIPELRHALYLMMFQY